MVGSARTGVSVLMVAVVLVLSQVALVSPAAAAGPVGPDWVPSQSSIPSSKMSKADISRLVDQLTKAGFKTSFADVAPRGKDIHLALQTAAAKGAYVPGLSDAARAAGVSPHAISAEQAGRAYSQYTARPGSGTLVAAQANSRGVYSITSMGSGATRPGSALVKAGTAMSRVLGPTVVAGGVVIAWEMGTAVGGGVANLVGLPTTGSMVCDLATAAFESDCGMSADTAYIANSDIQVHPPGWKNGKNWVSGVRWGPGGKATVTFDVLDSPLFGTTAGMAIVSALVTGTCMNGGWAPLSVGVGQISRRASDGAMLGSNTWRIPDEGLGEAYLGYPSCGNTSGVFRREYKPQAGLTYDHFEVLNGPGDEAIWYPEGHALRPPDTDPDPVRSFQTEWTCTSGPGGSAKSESYRESYKLWPSPPQAVCASGEVASLKITQLTENGPSEVVYEWKIPAGDAAFLDAYPQCGTGGCLLDLTTNVTGTDVSCFQSPELCTDWVHSSDRDTDYQCWYAGEKTVIQDCFLYGPTFNRTLVEEGKIYGDPETGEPLQPSGGVTPAPGTGTGNGPNPPQDPNCPPAFSITSVLSPWWYYKGLECGLRWAFVPSGVGGVTAGIFGAYEASAAGGLVDATEKLLSTPMSGSCGVLFAVQPSVFGGTTFSVDTCGPFWSGAAPIRALLGISMVLMSTIAGLRLALSALGVTMFDGKGAP